MSTQAQLQRWRAAGLLTDDQVRQIAAFEREHKRPTLLYAIAGLAGFAIAVGALSIVAANWDAIPGRAKIGCALAIVVATALGVLRLTRRGPAWALETSMLVFYGLVLAVIALIGQVYQLGGNAHVALGLWSALTALLMSRGRSKHLAFAWIVGLQLTYGVWVGWAADSILKDEWAIAIIYWAPLLTLLAGSWPPIADRRPALAKVMRWLGWAELVALASLGTTAFYADTRGEDWSPLWFGLMMSSVLTAAIAAWLPADRGRPWQRALLLACLLASHLPLLIPTDKLPVMAALALIGLWLVVAITAQANGQMSVLNLATAVIGLRILIVYFEVFGSLLGTGIGLVVGGLLTLALVWLWLRARHRFAAQPTEAQPTEMRS